MGHHEMNQRALAISILQKARDTLSERLSQRIIESKHEIADDAEGHSYLSEIETIYDQLGGRLAHLNAMLSSLPPDSPQSPADEAASEIVYADLASDCSSPLDLEPTAPITLLALPAPARCEEPPLHPLVEQFASICVFTQAGDQASTARVISEVFDIKPSQARRGAEVFAAQRERWGEYTHRLEQFASAVDETNEYAAATLLGECFGFQPLDALLLVRSLKSPEAEASEEEPIE
ncbi:MAG: hypothetical protein DWQ37_09640 [Planctomycetota bacterium]|nr:MAG: hypothetical protein DWQ37_09640 [Planctomycetota bacterium]